MYTSDMVNGCPERLNSSNRLKKRSRAPWIMGSARRIPSFEKYLPTAPRRMRCVSWSRVAIPASELPNTRVPTSYLLLRFPLGAKTVVMKSGSLTCSWSGPMRIMGPVDLSRQYKNGGWSISSFTDHISCASLQCENSTVPCEYRPSKTHTTTKGRLALNRGTWPRVIRKGCTQWCTVPIAPSISRKPARTGRSQAVVVRPWSLKGISRNSQVFTECSETWKKFTVIESGTGQRKKFRGALRAASATRAAELLQGGEPQCGVARFEISRLLRWLSICWGNATLCEGLLPLLGSFAGT